MSTSVTMEGRSLSELKVADLRRELEKRQKDKIGVKQVLVDRLKEALEEDGHDPLTYRFGNESEVNRLEADSTDQSSCCCVSLCDVASTQSVNGDDADAAHIKDDAPFNRDEPMQSDAVSEEQVEQKKISEEPVTYVVQVGDQEEDLDYDLKTESDVAIESNSNSQNHAKSTEATAKDTEQGSESSKTNKQVMEERKNLWVSNLPKNIKAADLKQHFSKSGKVVSATVVMSTRSPGGCFGFLQMASAEDAARAARRFDCSEYDGNKISVEATERKPPALTSKLSDHPNPLRSKHANTSAKGEVSRPRRRAQNRARRFALKGRPWYTRSRAAASRAAKSRRRAAKLAASEPRREPRVARPPPPRMNQRLLAYQSLKRASLLFAAARFGSSRSTHQREMVPPRNSGPPRSSPHLSRQSAEFERSYRFTPPDRRDTRPLMSPRRLEQRGPYFDRRRLMNDPYDLERSRPPTPPRTMLPPRRSEPVERDSPRLREPLPPPPSDRRRSLPSARPLDSHQRISRSPRSPAEASRPYGRPPSLHRPEGHAYERMDGGRQMSGSRQPPMSPPFDRVPEQYRSYQSVMERRPSPMRGYPSRPLPSPRREYRDISRSPPRSRNMALMRPYPNTSPQHDTRDSRPFRDDSPLAYNANNGVRPKVVDYGHRSDQRNDYPPWKGNNPRIQTPGHTWKPAGHSFVSNYGTRRY